MNYQEFLFGAALTVVGSILITFLFEKLSDRGHRIMRVLSVVGMIALVIFVPTWRLKLLFSLWFLFAIVGSLWREHRCRTKSAHPEVTRAT